MGSLDDRLWMLDFGFRNYECNEHRNCIFLIGREKYYLFLILGNILAFRERYG